MVSSRHHHRPVIFRLRGMTGQTTEASSGQATACNSNTSRVGDAQIAEWFELLSGLPSFPRHGGLIRRTPSMAIASPDCEMMRRE
jgi:hypothetical protein